MSSQLLFEVYEEPDGNIYRNTQSHTKHQYCRWFERYVQPTHYTGGYQQRNDIGYNSNDYYTPVPEQHNHAHQNHTKSPDQTVSKAVDNKFTSFKESNTGAGKGQVVIGCIEDL